jgi:Tol biopolymer transport system component
MQKFFRAVMLIAGTTSLALVAWLMILRADAATESSMIAFVSSRDDLRLELYTMFADGSGQRRILPLNDPSGQVIGPVWSPDGKWIVFTLLEPSNTDAQLYRIRPNGDDLQQLTYDSGLHVARSFSPDSQWIAYHNTQNVFIMRADGAEQIQLTQDGINQNPVWSPDGEWLVFLRQRPGVQSHFNIHRMRIDGSEARMLTPADFTDFNPAWSSDGEWIVFGSDLGSNFRDGYFRVHLDTLEMIGLGSRFSQQISTSHVNWSASGEWALYQARPEGNLDIYRTRADGSGVVRLTHHPAEDLLPTWSPPISLAWQGWINALAGLLLLPSLLKFVNQRRAIG